MRVQLRERRIKEAVLFASFHSNDVAFQLGFLAWIKQVFLRGQVVAQGYVGLVAAVQALALRLHLTRTTKSRS